MCFKNDKCSFAVVGAGEFFQGKEGVNRLDAGEVEFRQGELPATAENVVLKPALQTLNRDYLSRVDGSAQVPSQIMIPLSGY